MFLNEVFSGTTFLKHWGKGPLRVLANQRLGPRRWCYQRSKVKTRTSMGCQAASNTGRLQDQFHKSKKLKATPLFNRRGLGPNHLDRRRRTMADWTGKLRALWHVLISFICNGSKPLRLLSHECLWPILLSWKILGPIWRMEPFVHRWKADSLPRLRAQNFREADEFPPGDRHIKWRSFW